MSTPVNQNSQGRVNGMFQPLTESPYEMLTSSDGFQIECRYQGHPFWDKKKHICLALHLVMATYIANYKRGVVSSPRAGMSVFFDFAIAYNETAMEPFKLWHYEQITQSVFSKFRIWAQENGHPDSIASNFGSMLYAVGNMGIDLPQLNLGVGRTEARNPKTTKPIIGPTYDQLSIALTSHVDKLYQKIEFRKKVEQASAYTLEEVLEPINKKYSRAEFFEWMQLCLDKELSMMNLSIRWRIKATDDVELLGLLGGKHIKDEIQKIYAREGALYIVKDPQDRFQARLFHRWDPQPERLVKTFIEHGFPMDMNEETLSTRYSFEANMSLTTCTDIIDVIILRLTHFRHKKYPVQAYNTDEYLRMYYPSMADMACIVVFIMLQSNWNKETVLAVDYSNLEHPLTGAVQETSAVIQSEKNRSQGLGKPFHAPKEMIAVSSTTDIYSSYNLIQLAHELSLPLDKCSFDSIPFSMDENELNKLFLCLKDKKNWGVRGGRHTSISYNKAFNQGVKEFLREYPIYENGGRLTTTPQITKRLRATWAYQRQTTHGASLGMLALQMGHADILVTDEHYTSSPEALKEAREHLRSELESLIELFRQGRYQGLLSPLPTGVVDLPMKIFHIPGMEKPLWACMNQRKPTWAGAQNFVEAGQRCYSIQNCLGCRQCNIFDDSVLFLIQRQIHLEEILDDISEGESDYSNTFNTELNIINSILDNWDDPDLVREASRYQKRNAPLLPRDLGILQVIFEEEDME
jgi:hypothetical protein